MVSDFQSLAVSNCGGDDGIEKRMQFAEKLRKAKKSDILKGKRDELKKKTTDLSQPNDGKGEVSSKVITARQDAEPEPAVDMNELF